MYVHMFMPDNIDNTKPTQIRRTKPPSCRASQGSDSDSDSNPPIELTNYSETPAHHRRNGRQSAVVCLT